MRFGIDVLPELTVNAAVWARAPVESRTVIPSEVPENER